MPVVEFQHWIAFFAWREQEREFAEQVAEQRRGM